MFRLRASGGSLQDLGAPSPSERSAGGVQLPGRTRGGGVAHQIPLIVGNSGEGVPCRPTGEAGNQLDIGA